MHGTSGESRHVPVAFVGLSHHSAPVSIRERLALSADAVAARLAAIDRDRLWEVGVGEVALLSTCNRTELFVASRGVRDPLLKVPVTVISQLLGIDERDSELMARLQVRRGFDAVAHLCRVAAGLESMVLGESEILGQVSGAHGLAADAGRTGPLLDAIFRVAIRAGRRARAETQIACGSVSVASEAVRLADRLAPPTADRTVLLIGSGQVAGRVAELVRTRPSQVRVIGRSSARARELACVVGAEAVDWDQLTAAIAAADVVVSATSATGIVLPASVVREALAARGTRGPVHFIDLAVPRDIDPAVRELAGATLHDLDDVQARIASTLESRATERPSVEAIVDEEVQHFAAWLSGAQLRPLLAAMHARGEEIRRREMQRFERRNGGAATLDYDALEQMSRSLVAQLLHGPSARLRTETDPETSRQYAAALEALFGLSSEFELPERTA
jgi:glutamyl-tRNA reductase